jgi:hypothetical protein
MTFCMTHPDLSDPRDALGVRIRQAARLATHLAVTPHHPTLGELLRDLVLDVEYLWLAVDETQEEQS